MSQIALSLHGITKEFPGVKALDDVSLELRAGEVHALLGENGAGKSTLMKVLAGVYQADAGHIEIDGARQALRNPLDAKSKGVVLIHQELSLVSEMTAAENIYLGELPTKAFGQVDWKTLYDNANAILKKLNCSFSADVRVGDLSIANQQMIEIARALTVDAKAVIFDEPTASLTDAEKVVLFDVINDLKANGTAIVYISHRMEEIFHISDRISVLRDGGYRGTLVTAETDEDEVTRLMIGRSLDENNSVNTCTPGDLALEVKGLSCGSLFHDVSFKVHFGEVVGFYGLVGAGRTELAETLFGLRKPSSGHIELSGKTVHIDSPATAIEHGLSLVPESRKEQGLVLGMSCRDNTTLAQLDRLSNGPFVSTAKESEIFAKYKDQLSIKTPSWRQIVGNLSGGNQQKVVIAKWLSMHPKILIVDEPTRGIDVGSKAEIHQLIRDLAASGYAVIVISSEMPEVMRVSDQIVAMYHGEIMHTFSAESVTEDGLIQAISGLEVQSAKVAS